MRERVSLQKAINLLSEYRHLNKDCKDVLDEYYEVKKTNEFLAARNIVNLITSYYISINNKGAINGKN